MEVSDKTWVAIVSFVIVIVVAVGGVGFYYLMTQNSILQQQIAAINQRQTEEAGESLAVNGKTKAQSTASASSTVATSTSSAVPEDFKSYSNDNLGFFMNLPMKIGDRPEAAGVLESGSVAFITFNSSSYYAEILKRTKSTSTDIEKARGIPWAIVVKAVNSDAELLAFVKKRFGSGCSLGAKEEVASSGTFNVKITGDGKDLATTKCPTNFILIVKYSPNFKKAALWSIGQDYNFPSLIGGKSSPADQMMADSFKFTK